MMDSDTTNTGASLRIGQAYVLDIQNVNIISDAVCDASADTVHIGSAGNTNLFVCEYCNKAL